MVQSDRGYKANITTYTVAWLSHVAREQFGCSVNLEEVWREQAVPKTIQRVVEEVSPRIAKVIKTPVSGVVNITEYAKKAFAGLRCKKSG